MDPDSDKGRKSPAKDHRETPTKRARAQSPVKLDVGKDGFYFSMELPESKITPKKKKTVITTPRRGIDGTPGSVKSQNHPTKLRNSPASMLFGTPKTTATKSKPTTPQTEGKERRPVRGTPNHSSPKQKKGLFGTPKRKGVVGTPDCARPGSPVKRAIEMDESVGPVGKVSQPHKVNPVAQSRRMPENIGQLMAGLSSSNSSSVPQYRERAPTDGTLLSPAPTPLRRASERLGLAGEPSYLRLSTNSIQDITNAELGREQMRKGSTGPQEVPVTVPPPDREKEGPASTSVAMLEQNKLNQQAADTLLFGPPPSTLSSSPKANPTPSLDGPSQSHATAAYSPLLPVFSRPDLSQSPTRQSHIALPPRTPTQRRAGTDPILLQKLKNEMANVEVSFRRSLGLDPFNRSEGPGMSRSLFVRGRGDVRSPGAVGSPIVVSWAGTEMEDVVGREKMEEESGSLDHLVALDIPKNAAQARGKKEATVVADKVVAGEKKVGRGRSIKPPTIPSKVPVKALRTPRIVHTTPSRTRAKPATPSVKPKTSTSSIPKPTAHAQKFVSATDIADKVAEWNNEDKDKKMDKKQVETRAVAGIKKALPTKPSTSTPRKPSPKRNPENTPKPSSPIRKNRNVQTTESTTPKSSPKFPNPIFSPTSKSPVKSKRTIPPPPPSSPPKRMAPRTPLQPPKTPGNRRFPPSASRGVMDRNAHRTPSKDIVSSLDRAIDEKIAEDRRRGGWFE
jgi:hypothetical protein